MKQTARLQLLAAMQLSARDNTQGGCQGDPVTGCDRGSRCTRRSGWPHNGQRRPLSVGSGSSLAASRDCSLDGAAGFNQAATCRNNARCPDLKNP